MGMPHSLARRGTSMARKAQMGKMARREERAFYLFISPWIVGFILFSAGPAIGSCVISFTQWSLLSAPSWTGTSNYQRLVGDPLFWQALTNTLYFAAGSVGLGTAFALLLALLLNQDVKGQALFRTIFYLPAVVSGVAVAILWRYIYNPDYGLANSILHLVGIKGPDWLGDPSWAMPAMIVMSLWAVGGSMVIYLAGLQGIPAHLYEAAALDGAGALRKFWHVTVPMMSPVIFFNLVVGVIGSFQAFVQMYVMTNGGPANATLVYLLYLYRNAFEDFDMGYASALAWVLFLLLLAITLGQMALARRWVYYEGQLRG
jgi:multiple sugar transport system permease protein